MNNKLIFAFLAGAGVVGLSACSTATPRTAALYAPKVIVTGSQPPGTIKPVMANSGVYPTFGPPITAANQQMEDVEATRVHAQLAGLNAAYKAGTVSDAQYKAEVEDLRKLAVSHTVDMQNRIAN